MFDKKVRQEFINKNGRQKWSTKLINEKNYDYLDLRKRHLFGHEMNLEPML